MYDNDNGNWCLLNIRCIILSLFLFSICVQLNVRSKDTKASICFQDGAESVNIITSFNLSLYKRKTKVSFVNYM